MEVSGQLHAAATLSGVGTLGTHWAGGSVSPRTVLDTVLKRKNPIIVPAGNRTPVVQLGA